MAKYDNLWQTILKCGGQDQLPNWAWKQLNKIASAMNELEMSGSKLSRGDKRNELLAVLGYNEGKDISQLGRTERDLKFLEAVYKKAQKEYGGRMNKLYFKENDFLQDEDSPEGETLKQRVERIRKRLDIATFAGRGSSGKVKFQDILDNYEPDRDETPPPLIERYISELTACKGQIKVYDARQRKQRDNKK